MATTIQNLRSLTAGNYPGDLVAGELAFNLADGFMYLGSGGNSYVDTLNQTIGPSLAPGGGWQQAVWNSSPINGSVELAGIYDAQSNLVTSVTTAGTAAGFTVGVLPASTPANTSYYVLVQIGGVLTPPAPTGSAQPGDWLVSSGTGWSVVAESEVVIPASNVTIIPTGPFTGPDMQDVLNQIQLAFVNNSTGIMSELNCNGNAEVFGSTTLGDTSADTLTVNATSAFAAPVALAQTLTVAGTASVTGAFSALSTGYIVGNFRVDGNIDARGSVSLGNAITDTVTIAGPIAAGNNLTVTGSTTLNGATAINGSLTTTGAVSVAGTAGVGITANVVFSGSSGITVGTNNPIDISSASVFFRPSTGVTISGALVLNGAANFKSTLYTRPLVGSGGTLLQAPLQNFLVAPGTIISFAGLNFPDGYVVCNGQSLPTTGGYSDLFSAIGYTWGGSGVFFNVPDLRGQFLRGAGQSAARTTSTGSLVNGNTVGTFQVDSFQAHNHAFTTPTVGYAGVQFGSQREALAVPTTQMTSSGRPNSGTIQMLNTNDQGNVNSTPVNTNGSTVETKPVSASVQYLIKF